jgi:hypothetical protein
MKHSKSRSAVRLGVVAAMVATTALSGAAGASAHSHHHHGAIKGEVSNNRGHDIGIKTIVRLFEKDSSNHFVLVSQKFTNKHGEFKFKGLDRGYYYLEALGNAGLEPWQDGGTYRSEFYQNARTPEHSSRIHVHKNDTTKLHEIKLTRN